MVINDGTYFVVCLFNYITLSLITSSVDALLCWTLVGSTKISSILVLSNAVDSENESAAFESKVGKETIDFKEVKRVDHILASLQRKVIR